MDQTFTASAAGVNITSGAAYQKLAIKGRPGDKNVFTKAAKIGITVAGTMVAGATGTLQLVLATPNPNPTTVLLTRRAIVTVLNQTKAADGSGTDLVCSVAFEDGTEMCNLDGVGGGAEWYIGFSAFPTNVTSAIINIEYAERF